MAVTTQNASAKPGDDPRWHPWQSNAASFLVDLARYILDLGFERSGKARMHDLVVRNWTAPFPLVRRKSASLSAKPVILWPV